ncbi:MAG TPA: hypothetical protein VH370_23855 [Humisphaera sp.]|jgi:hypothetical protein|nr:hypothetical protein [Humisphaera sp.]
MTQYIVRRLIFGVILIFMASVLCFALLRAAARLAGRGGGDGT